VILGEVVSPFTDSDFDEVTEQFLPSLLWFYLYCCFTRISTKAIYRFTGFFPRFQLYENFILELSRIGSILNNS